MQQFESNNYALLCGTVVAVPELSHLSRGERFYRFPLCVERLSGAVDRINVIARERLIAPELCAGARYVVEGEVRSFNNKSGVGARLVIVLFARVLTPAGEGQHDANLVRLTGTLCKQPTLRTTPRGREICDLMTAVNRRCARSDYLPCIAWGERAARAAQWSVGDVISLEGRFQSREYRKQTESGVETRTAFEISAAEIERT